MNKIMFLCLIFSIIVLLTSNVLADGGMYTHVITYEKDEWVPIGQDKQVCVISYENGKESMMISVKGELEGSEVTWIFPVPAKPEKTTIDIIKEFPKFSGYEVKSKVGYELHDKIPVFALSQVYPIFYYYFFGGMPAASTLGGLTFGRGAGLREDTGVIIHEHLEKAGLTTELVTAKDENKLYAYLKEKNLGLPNESLSLIREYIGKDYSFVISWISNVTKYEEETGGNVLGIKTEFPTKDIYYPLKLTSIYGERKIPVLIYVSGHVNPKVYREIKDETKVNYYIGEKKYTKIEINAKSNHFVEDLWISRFAPSEILLADFILFNPTIFLIIVFALLSCLASIFSGLIVFRKEVSLKKLSLIGLSNFLTLIGFSIVARIAIKEEKRKKNKYFTIIFYSWFLLTVLFFILAWAFKSVVLLLIAFISLFLLLIPLIAILAETPKKFGFILLFSVIFLILTGVFYSFIESVYPYKVYSFSLTECRGIITTWCEKCKVLNWSGSEPSNYEVSRCAEIYFGVPPTSCADAKDLCSAFRPV